MKQPLAEYYSIIQQLRQRIMLEQGYGIHTILKTGAPLEGSAAKAQQLRILEQAVRKCQRCDLARTRTQVVFGSGSPQARLLILGEAPGFHEDRQGEPFVGEAGQLLTRILASIGLSRETVYICNILKCRPPRNRNPLEHEIAQCRPWLTKQIAIVAPQIICAMGRFASSWLTGANTSMGRMRGKTYRWQGIPVICTYHPAYLLRQPAEKRKTWTDIQRVRDFLQAQA